MSAKRKSEQERGRVVRGCCSWKDGHSRATRMPGGKATQEAGRTVHSLHPWTAFCTHFHLRGKRASQSLVPLEIVDVWRLGQLRLGKTKYWELGKKGSLLFFLTPSRTSWNIAICLCGQWFSKSTAANRPSRSSGSLVQSSGIVPMASSSSLEDDDASSKATQGGKVPTGYSQLGSGATFSYSQAILKSISPRAFLRQSTGVIRRKWSTKQKCLLQKFWTGLPMRMPEVSTMYLGFFWIKTVKFLLKNTNMAQCW